MSGSVMDADRRLHASGYGELWNLERDDAGGRLHGTVVNVTRLLAMLDIRTGNPVLLPATIGNLFTLASTAGGHGFDMAAVVDDAAGSYYGFKGGSLPESSQNCVRYRTDDYSMVVNWNRSDIAEGGTDAWWYPNFPAVLTAARAHNWESTDLFPHFGMPSFGPASGTGCLTPLLGRSPRHCWDPDEADAQDHLLVLTSLNPTQAERMPGRIGVDLEVVGGVAVLRRHEHLRTQRHDTIVRHREVLYPEVEVDLLGRCPVGPVGRDVVGRQLNPDPWVTVNDHHVPVILGIDSAVKHRSTEAALGGEVCGVEHDHLMIDAHPVIPSGTKARTWVPISG